MAVVLNATSYMLHILRRKHFLRRKWSKIRFCRATIWAKYAFPDQDFSTVDALLKLYTRGLFLCSDHFAEDSFSEGKAGRLRLHSVPIGSLSAEHATKGRIYQEPSSPVVDCLTNKDKQNSAKETGALHIWSRAGSANTATTAEGENSAFPTADTSAVTLSAYPQPQREAVQSRTSENSACSTSRIPTTSILTKLHEQNSRDGETSSFNEGNLSNAEPVQVKVENDDWGDFEDTCEASSLSPEIQDAHHLSGTEPSPHFQNLAENLPSGLQSVLKPDLSVCRLCLGKKEVVCPIFPRSDVGKSDNPEIEISDILASIPLTVREGDGLPQKVCQKCYNQLIIWYNFREMCISTDIILKQYISNMSLSADTDPLECVNDMNTSNQMSGPSDKLESSTCTADVFTIVTEQGSPYESDSRTSMSSPSDENIRLILKEARPGVKELSKAKVLKVTKQQVSVTGNITIPVNKAKLLPNPKKRTLPSEKVVLKPIHIQTLHEVPAVVQLPPAVKTPQEDESSIPSKKSRSNNESGRYETTHVDINQQKTAQKATIVEVHCNVESENNAPPPLEISNVVLDRTVLTDGVKYYTVAHESAPDVTMKSSRGECRIKRW